MGFPGSSNAARRRASWQWAGADTLAWVAATYSGLLLRYDFDVSRIFGWGALVFAVAAVALHLTLGYLLGPYQVRHTSASFEEVVDLARSGRSLLCARHRGPLGVDGDVLPPDGRQGGAQQGRAHESR